MNGECDMINRACDCTCDTMAKVGCSDGLGGDICAQLCIYVFGYVHIVFYDIGGCNIDMVIDPEEVD